MNSNRKTKTALTLAMTAAMYGVAIALISILYLSTNQHLITYGVPTIVIVLACSLTIIVAYNANKIPKSPKMVYVILGLAIIVVAVSLMTATAIKQPAPMAFAAIAILFIISGFAGIGYSKEIPASESGDDNESSEAVIKG